MHDGLSTNVHPCITIGARPTSRAAVTEAAVVTAILNRVRTHCQVQRNDKIVHLWEVIKCAWPVHILMPLQTLMAG